MTKDAYFEMCAMMNSEPKESEIPVELDDFPTEVQQAFSIYGKLRDDWDGMSGTYMGKHLEGIRDLFIILDVPVQDHKIMLELVEVIDKNRSKILTDSKAAKAPTKPAPR
jgi:hypothetical protein